MKRWQLGIALIPIFLTVAAAAPAAEPDLSKLVHLFEYDSHQSLDIHDKTVKDFNCGVIKDITYVSPSGGLVSAYEIVPKGKGPFAAVIFGHWGNGTRGEFIPEAKAMLARAWFRCFPTTAGSVRDRGIRKWTTLRTQT